MVEQGTWNWRIVQANVMSVAFSGMAFVADYTSGLILYRVQRRRSWPADFDWNVDRTPGAQPKSS